MPIIFLDLSSSKDWYGRPVIILPAVTGPTPGSASSSDWEAELMLMVLEVIPAGRPKLERVSSLVAGI